MRSQVVRDRPGGRAGAARPAGAGARQPARGNGTHRPTFCVWELGAVCHEQQAWSRFLRSERGVAERAAYLRDTVTGEV
ncbi:MAG: hypothetical protein ACXWZB_03920 [Gaiellaceae bacterium]